MEDIFHLGIKALIKNKEDKLLLLKVNPAMLKGKTQKPYWDIPGGRIKKGDSVEDTLKREVHEETGIENIKSFIPFNMVLSKIRIPMNDNTDVGLILGAYICEVDDVERIKISEEHIQAEWFSPLEASKLLTVKYPDDFCKMLQKL